MAPPSVASVALLSVNMELSTTTLPPVISRALPRSAWLRPNTEVRTARPALPLTSMAPPGSSSKKVSEIDTCPSETNSARVVVPVVSRRPGRALGLPKRQPAISTGTSTVPPSMITCPSSFSPCRFTGGEPARTSSRVEALLEMTVRPEASLEMISSRLSVRLALSTKPLTMCSPADSLMTNSLPEYRCVALSPPPNGSITTDLSGGGGEGGGGEGGGGEGGGGEGGGEGGGGDGGG
eukprot:scaffold20625_cov59-Phaeocystis_antarctica.AAC.1